MNLICKCIIVLSLGCDNDRRRNVVSRIWLTTRTVFHHRYTTNDTCRTYYMSLLLNSSVIITHHYIHTSLIYMSDILYVFTSLNSSVIITHHYIHTSLIYMLDILYVFTVKQFSNHNTPLHTYITDIHVGHIICLYCYTVL